MMITIIPPLSHNLGSISALESKFYVVIESPLTLKNEFRH